MNQASVTALRAGIEKAKVDWAANPENEGIPMVALQLPVLEELLDDLVAANDVNVKLIADREAKKAKRKK